MGVHFDSSGIRDLAADYGRVPLLATKRVDAAVSKVANRGNLIAKNFARESAGDTGKLYHLAFEAERERVGTFVYGPNAAMPQGGMSFEYGSRNSPPHLDLNRSADIIGPMLSREVRDAVGDSLRGV